MSYIDTNLWVFFNILIFIFFSTQFNNNSNNKNLSNPWVQPDSCGLGWVGLDLYDGLDWVEFLFTHHGGLGQKIPLT